MICSNFILQKSICSIKNLYLEAKLMKRYLFILDQMPEKDDQLTPESASKLDAYLGLIGENIDHYKKDIIVMAGGYVKPALTTANYVAKALNKDLELYDNLNYYSVHDVIHSLSLLKKTIRINKKSIVVCGENAYYKALFGYKNCKDYKNYFKHLNIIYLPSNLNK